MTIQDERSEEQKDIFTVLIFGRDTYLSNWEDCNVKTSYCAWAVKPEHEDIMLDWVESRGDIVNIAVKESDYVPSMKEGDHFQVYVPNIKYHPAFKHLRQRKE